jgi:F-type H+-transporting ATPase subunit b
MGLITPDYGLLVWMLISFGILMYLLKKYAWKPILHSIKSREEMIAKSLRDAELARKQIDQLKENQNRVIAKAQAERDEILAQAKKTKDRIIDEANKKAQADTQKQIEQARTIIKKDKEAAQLEIKAYASQIVLQAAERILRSELKDKQKYEDQVAAVIKEISENN